MKKILFSLLLFLPFIVKAQPGTLDKSFADNGIALYKNITGTINKIAVQSDGKIIGAGDGGLNDAIPVLLIRYNIDGSVDSGFGTDGVAGYNDLSQAVDMAIEPDDEIIAVGRTAIDVHLAKYKKDGAKDSSFGVNGTVITSAGANDVPTGIALQTDGKIVVCGYIINEPNEATQGFLIRYLPDGGIDESFGENGKVIIGDITGDKSLVNVNALVSLSNGQILVSLLKLSSEVYRFNSNGSRDYSFGDTGIAVFQSVNISVKSFKAADIAIQPDGKILGVGNGYNKKAFPTVNYMTAARLNADGSIDSSFGDSGLQHVLFGNDLSAGVNVLLQNDGKVIITGRTYNQLQTHSHLALARFNADGKLDSAFGINGQVVTEVEGYAAANSALLQKDKKILLGGDTFIGDFSGHTYFVLARYNNDTLPPPTPITRIKRWLHKHGITWDDCPPSICDNITGYVVQRSTNGKNWSTVFSRRRSANTPWSTVSSYADPSPLPGTNYYRLQTTSVSGAVATSNVIAVTSDVLNVSLSPNPAKNTLSITGLPANEKMKLTVVDFSGNLKMQAVANASSYSLNIASLHAGNYVIKMDINGEVVSKQFVKE